MYMKCEFDMLILSHLQMRKRIRIIRSFKISLRLSIIDFTLYIWYFSTREKMSIIRIISGTSPGRVAFICIQEWYLFGLN